VGSKAEQISSLTKSKSTTWLSDSAWDTTTVERLEH